MPYSLIAMISPKKEKAPFFPLQSCWRSGRVPARAGSLIASNEQSYSSALRVSLWALKRWRTPTGRSPAP
jgi:hypothetical protein